MGEVGGRGRIRTIQNALNHRARRLGLSAFIIGAAIYTNRYTKSVGDFLAANRCAGRYLLCISSGMAGLGAISIVAFFEMYYAAGFTAVWWSMMLARSVV